MKKSDERKLSVLSHMPNFLTISRIALTFVVMYMIFAEVEIWRVIIVFAIAALTDFFDGRLARRFKWTSEFGRKADMVADRFLWVGTALAFVISFGLQEKLNWLVGVQLLLIMLRELVSMPFAVVAFFSGNLTPSARYIAKATTFIQGFALPAIILSAIYPVFNYISIPLSLICAVTGFISGLYYLQDIHAPTKPIKIMRRK